MYIQYFVKESNEIINHTEAIIAVEAPSLAAATHWLAPLPPYFISYLLPIIVSPGFGKREEKLKKQMYSYHVKRSDADNLYFTLIYFLTIYTS